MATFDYIARTTTGESLSGVMQAENDRAVARALDEKKLFPVQIVERVEQARMVRRRVSARQIGVAYGQLGDLLARACRC